jgi:hypothetical protein
MAYIMHGLFHKDDDGGGGGDEASKGLGKVHRVRK